jgi:hypothetical protein
LNHINPATDTIDSYYDNSNILLFRYRIPIFFISFISIVLFSIINLSLSTFISYLLFGFIGFNITALIGKDQRYIYTIVYSFATLFAIILFYIFIFHFNTPYGGGGSDSKTYENYAEIVSKNLLYYNSNDIGFIIEEPYHNSKGYIYLLSFLIRFGSLFGGFNTMIARLFNANLLALCSILIYSISKQINLSRNQKINASLITGLFPIMVFVGTQTFRDIPILFLFLISVRLAYSIMYSKSFFKILFNIITIFLIIIIMMEFRFVNILNIIIVLFASIYFKLSKSYIITYKKIILYVTLILFIFSYLLTTEIELFISLSNNLIGSGKALSEGFDRAEEDGLSLILFNLPSPIKYFAIVGYAFITPLPIIYTQSIDWNFLSLGTIFQFLFIPFVILGIKMTFRNLFMLPIFVMFIITFSGYVFGSFTFRHIVYIVPFAAIYGVIGFENYKKYKFIFWFFGSLILIGLMGTYFLIKIIK